MDSRLIWVKSESPTIKGPEHKIFELISNVYNKCSKISLKLPIKNIDKTKILMTNGSLMKVKSIAECSHWSILQYF